MSSPDTTSVRSPEERWWSVRAGEYVLGTLRGKDLALFEQILAHDTAVQGEVDRWERRLAPLGETTLERVPGEHVWPLVLERIRTGVDGSVAGRAEEGGGAAAGRPSGAGVDDAGARDESRTAGMRPAGESAGTSAAGATSSRVVPLRSAAATSSAWRSPVWPALTALATAASVLLGGLLFQQTSDSLTAPLSVDGLAVVLADEDGEPYFLVETDYGNLRVRVTALSPPDLDDERDFQLWQALPDRSSVRPVALLPEEAGASRVFEVDSLIDGSDLFGVSIEPIGAPTDDGPTGPVVAHGDFQQTSGADD